MLHAGLHLGGYRIGDLVGRGGMGEVYRATQLSMDREVALKVLSPRLAKQDPSFAAKFVAEARAAGKLNHPNIVGVHDVANAPAPEGCSGVVPGETVHFFSMEFIDGESVRDVIDRQGAMDIAAVERIAAGMAEALGFAEAQGIVHRDIKPDNIMLTANGLVKLADLGLALHLDSAEAVAGAGKDEQGRTKVMGTPLYMSPEQARGQPVDHRSDQYALGATLFHMLTGRPPYAGSDAKTIMRSHCFDPIPDPLELNPEIPPPWAELCRRLMAKTAAERFATSADLRAAIKAAIRWHPSAAAAPAGNKRSLWVGLAAGVVVLGLAGWWFTRPAAPAPAPNQGQPSPPAQTQTQPPGQQPGRTIRPLTPADPAADARERARQALAALPANTAAALAEIERLRAEPALAPALDLLDARAGELRQAVIEAQRAAVRGQLDKAEADLRAGRLRAAQTAVAALPDDDWLHDAKQQVATRLDAAINNLASRIDTAIATATTPATCDALATEIANAELDDARRAGLRGKLDTRRAALTQTAPAPKKPPQNDIADQWRYVSTAIERVRGGWPYADFADGCASLRTLPEPERSTLTELGNISTLAQQVETALRLYIGQTQPKVDCKFGTRTGSFILTRLEKDSIGFRLPDIPAESRAERATAVLPWTRLIRDAQNASGKEDPRATAAFLWYWRMGEAAEAITAIREDPLGRAIVVYEQLSRPIPVPGILARRDALLEVAYPFATAKSPDLLTAWDGTGLTQVDRGLRWTSTKVIAKATANEADLPTVRWLAALAPPVTLQATAIPEVGTEVALVGLQCDNQIVRVAMNHRLRKAFLLATKADGTTYEPLAAAKPVDYNVFEGVKIKLAVDVDGKVQVWANDRALLSERPLAFAPGKKLTAVLQLRQFDKQAGMIVPSIVLTGRP
jgi:serine/threonine-protein kinase